MRVMLSRQRRVRSAAVAASILLLAACGKQTPDQDAGPNSSPPATITYAAGALLVSDGTPTVLIDGKPVTFPTSVTDAAWSPDGSRIAFIDADGNIATAHPDGSGLLVLTTAKPGVVRSSPTWNGGRILFARKSGNGPSDIISVASNGNHVPDADTERVETWTMDDGPTNDSDPDGNAAAGSAKEYAFVRERGQGSEVWISDSNGRSPWTEKRASGSQPALSPDGTRVAFVAPNGQITVLSRTDARVAPVQVTFDASGPAHLTWTPDGSRIAFTTPSDVRSVAANVASGATTNPSTQIAPAPGIVSFLQPSRDRITRISGPDPVDMAIAASQARWPTVAQFVATESDVPARGATLIGPSTTADAIPSSSAYAVLGGGPALVTAGPDLDPRVEAELKRIFGTVDPSYNDGIDPQGPHITVIGGTSVLSVASENKLKGLGYRVSRSLPDVQVPGSLEARTVLVLPVGDPAAAAMASSLTGFTTMLVFADGGSLPAASRAVLNRVTSSTKVYAVGPEAKQALASSWSGKPKSLAPIDLPGSTSAERVNSLLGLTGDRPVHLVVVDRSSPINVAIAQALAVSSAGGTLLEVDGKAEVDTALRAWLNKSSGAIDRITIVQPDGTISPQVEKTLGDAVSGPLGFTVDANPKEPAFH